MDDPIDTTAAPRPRRRRPWLAGLLTLACPGLGQLYNGDVAIALLGFALMPAALVAYAFLTAGAPLGLLSSLATYAAAVVALLVHAAVRARRLGEVPLRRFNRWWAYLLIALAVNIGVRALLGPALAPHARFRAYRIPTGGMEPTVQVGDFLIADNWVYRDREPARGDVIVFRYPLEPTRDFLKRCVAVPGDTVEIRDKRLIVNGEPLDEPYAEHRDRLGLTPGLADEARRRRDNYGPFRVPDGTFFCLGDNRDNSYDSRFWGPVPRELVTGRALYLYWSADRARIGARLAGGQSRP